MVSKSQSLQALFNRGTPSQTNFQVANKHCAYAARGERLEGVCIYATPDPIDKFTVAWKIDTSTNGGGQNFGVALKTETVRKGSKSNYRGEEHESEETESASGLADKWFSWSTDGGGIGYEVHEHGTELHYGEVDLQVIEYSYEYATPRADALQLVPQYSHTRSDPDSTNICIGPSGSSDLSRCADDPVNNRECAQLKLGPAAVKISDRRSIVSPVNAYLGGIGGIISLLLLTLTTVNSTLTALCKSKLGIFAPQVQKDADIAKV